MKLFSRVLLCVALCVGFVGGASGTLGGDMSSWANAFKAADKSHVDRIIQKLKAVVQGECQRVKDYNRKQVEAGEPALRGLQDWMNNFVTVDSDRSGTKSWDFWEFDARIDRDEHLAACKIFRAMTSLPKAPGERYNSLVDALMRVTFKEPVKNEHDDVVDNIAAIADGMCAALDEYQTNVLDKKWAELGKPVAPATPAPTPPAPSTPPPAPKKEVDLSWDSDGVKKLRRDLAGHFDAAFAKGPVYRLNLADKGAQGILRHLSRLYGDKEITDIRVLANKGHQMAQSWNDAQLYAKFLQVDFKGGASVRLVNRAKKSFLRDEGRLVWGDNLIELDDLAGEYWFGLLGATFDSKEREKLLTAGIGVFGRDWGDPGRRYLESISGEEAGSVSYLTQGDERTFEPAKAGELLEHAERLAAPPTPPAPKLTPSSPKAPASTRLMTPPTTPAPTPPPAVSSAPPTSSAIKPAPTLKRAAGPMPPAPPAPTPPAVTQSGTGQDDAASDADVSHSSVISDNHGPDKKGSAVGRTPLAGSAAEPSAGTQSATITGSTATPPTPPSVTHRALAGSTKTTPTVTNPTSDTKVTPTPHQAPPLTTGAGSAPTRTTGASKVTPPTDNSKGNGAPPVTPPTSPVHKQPAQELSYSRAGGLAVASALSVALLVASIAQTVKEMKKHSGKAWPWIVGMCGGMGGVVAVAYAWHQQAHMVNAN